MLPFEDRFTRQRQLPEVGAEGQQRIAALRVVGPADRAGEVAAAYLRRAGVAEVTLADDQPVPVFPHASSFRFSVARAHGEGCHRAMNSLRACLSLGESRT